MQNVGKVSIVIPNYNYADYVSAAINSVLNQTYSNIEVIVVNNGSTDHSLEVLTKFGEKIVLVNQENLGQAGARNSGLARATGDFIAFLDADDVWHPDKLEKQINLFNSKVELVYSGINYLDESLGKVVGHEIPRFRGECYSDFLDYPGVSIVLSGESTSVITKSLAERNGLFDSDLNSASGWDFFRRCSKQTQFDFVPETLVDYRLHALNMSKSVDGNISDIRTAYKKIFNDEVWTISKPKVIWIIYILERNFIKTYLKKSKFVSAFFSPFIGLKSYLRS
jgi:glycosyltransferase involved in cell wall biosynthesis